MELTEQERFFYENAGYSYDPNSGLSCKPTKEERMNSDRFQPPGPADEPRNETQSRICTSCHKPFDADTNEPDLWMCEDCLEMEQQAEDMAMLIRRLCRVVARHDANNTVRAQALDYLHRKGFGGTPLKTKGQ